VTLKSSDLKVPFFLACGQAVRPDHEIGNDPSSTTHDPPGIRVIDGTLLDGGVGVLLLEIRGAVGSLGGRLRQLVFLILGDPLNRAPARRIPAGRGQLERHAVAEGEERLDQALAERGRPDDHGAVVVLQRTGDDLRGTRGAVVDEHDDGQLGP
jgi:hypothetical protein